MKCVKFVDGTVKRVSDISAHNIVISGEGVYISKQEYKKHNDIPRTNKKKRTDQNKTKRSVLSKKERKKRKNVK